jgi:hypothetical protein
MLTHRDRRATQSCVKIRPPRSGCPEVPASDVACLRVAPLRDCTALLASGHLEAITTIAGTGYTP